MEEKTEFSVYLFSNGDMGTFPKNKGSNFKNRIAKELSLKGSWEVGLRQMSYPNKFQNVDETCEFDINFGILHIPSQKKYYDAQRIVIPAGYYHSLGALLERINSAIYYALEFYMRAHPDVEIRKAPMYHTLTEVLDYSPSRLVNAPQFKLWPETGLVYLYNVEFDFFEIDNMIGYALWQALGYAQNVKFLRHFKFGSEQPSLTRRLPALIIYTSIISPCFVGDGRVPVLAVVPIKGREHHYVTETIDSITYVPVSHKYLSEVNIRIQDSAGKRVNFGDGIVALQLHFRRNE